MFRKLFGLDKKEAAPIQPKEEVLHAPLTGKTVAIEEVPDPTFAQKMMGDGFAIEPTEGKVVSPVSGEIMQVFPTKHAIGIKTEAELEILIHIGLETVGMNGEGFTAHIKEGDRVQVGDLLVDFDIDLVRERAASTITPIVITNMDLLDSIDKELNIEVTAGETPVLTAKYNR
ncbi:PTS sugar transporter subunit IIA [Halalkalibacter krulwichiae]|uniref:Glucose-specific phosphotransferase enzyme IIA component n=1 Tax=Halalkalibacter krulwichiae TaxID=199441 RepID=A0A1X9MGB3_9BACI|nr:PTS glucose transporter subunit IIA [Halalkalibacter krulwichiae]ARK29472.1 Glucose-specific phosphotransferase enzyme IIA component [Halalkalibacter krulwichiae]